MKKIKLKTLDNADKTSIRTKQRKHSIFLRPGLTVYFTDIKDARAFLVKTSEFLTFQFFQLSEIQIEVYAQYRRAWWYSDQEQTGRISGAFADIENCYRLAFERSHWTNGAPYVFKWIQQVSEALNVVLDILTSIHKKRGNFAELRILSAIRARISFVIGECLSWPPDQA